jgi:hypothetical protein
MKLATNRQIANAIFTAAPHPYLLLTPTFEIAWVNEAYAEATLARPSDLVGRQMFDMFPDNPDSPEAQGVNNLAASLRHVLKDRRSDAMPVQRYDVRDRNNHFVEKYWLPTNSPVFGDDGELEFILHHVSDATGMIKQEAVSQETTHRYANLLAKAQALVLLSKLCFCME